MTKLYIILPLLALAGFGYVYHDFSANADLRAEKQKQEELAAKTQQLAAEAKARESSIQEALKQQAKRKQERLAREEAEKARKEARQQAVDTRDAALRETEKLARSIEFLKKDIAAEQTVKNVLLADQKSFAAEDAFQKEAAAKVVESNKSLQDVLDKIAAAEKAIADRKAAEAAAAKKAKED
jgi:hypothetical protein